MRSVDTRVACHEGCHVLSTTWQEEWVNCGNAGEVAILERAEPIRRLSGGRWTIVYDAVPKDDTAVRRPDITRAQTLLDWSPTIGLEEGLRLTLATMGHGVSSAH